MPIFPADATDLTPLLVLEYGREIRAFVRDPDGHRFEISERSGAPR